MKKFILISLVLVLSLGYSAILKWPDDCNKEGAPNPMVCYHSVAMTYALINDATKAVFYCNKVMEEQSIMTKGQANRCFRDIAVILEDESICEHILTGGLKFGQVKELCKKEAKAEQEKTTDCVIAYIVPFVILGSFFFRSSVH